METTASLAPAAPPAAPTDSRGLRQLLGVYLAPVLVLIATSAVAAVEYGRFLEVHRHLWSGALHDRNAHYQSALSLALDLRQGNVGQFLHDFDGIRVWPPLHALLAAAVLTIGGPDYRLAVLPSLAAWIGTVLLSFLTARRAAPRGGNLAGGVAALLILTSAAHRAFATDVMLESLGACLTLLVLYLYLVTVQSTSARPGRWLAVALTALFLTKYNYWALVVFALVGAEVSARPRIYRQLFLDAWGAIDRRRSFAAELRHPLNYLIAAVLALLVYVVTTGGTELIVGTHHVSLRTPDNLATAAYALVLLRVGLWWRRDRAAVLARLDERARPLVAWHLWPAALWMLLPKRLACFLWYVSPANTGEQAHYNLRQSLNYYWPCVVDDYGEGVWPTVLLLALVGLVALTTRRLRPGGRVLLWFVVIAAVLMLHHPNRKSRYLHTWVTAGWMVAGVGLARLVNGRLTRRVPAVRPWLSVAALGGLGAVYLPMLATAGHAPEGGPRPLAVSSLELTDCYQPCLAESRQAAVLSNLPMKFLCQWTYLERHGRRGQLETDVKDYGISPEENRASVRRWLATTHCDSVVFIDVPRDSCFYEHVPICDSYERLRGLLEEQTTFAPVRRWRLPQSGATVTLWTRNPAVVRAAAAVD